MSGKAEKALRDARELAEEMEADGQFRAAEVVRRVCRGNAAARTACKQLWDDNAELRQVVERQSRSLAFFESQLA
jgi:hypothetical protein